jgi:hypothetical protein
VTTTSEKTTVGCEWDHQVAVAVGFGRRQGRLTESEGRLEATESCGTECERGRARSVLQPPYPLVRNPAVAASCAAPPSRRLALSPMLARRRALWILSTPFGWGCFPGQGHGRSRESTGDESSSGLIEHIFYHGWGRIPNQVDPRGFVPVPRRS